MYLTPDNASEYLGKELDASTRRFHYYPLEVIQFPDGEYGVKDNAGVCSKVDDDKFNQPFFDIVDGVSIEETSNFKWDMTEQNYEKFIDVVGRSRHEPITDYTCSDAFGTATFGKYQIEIHHTLDESSWYAYTEVYKQNNKDEYEMLNNLGFEVHLMNGQNFVDYKTFKKSVENDFLSELSKVKEHSHISKEER